jgi:reactive chlorine resistance protein C
MTMRPISCLEMLPAQKRRPRLEKNMSCINPVITLNIDDQVAAMPSQDSSAGPSKSTQRSLTGLAAWINDHNVAFLVTSIGMIVMLLWAGSYKMTAPGAEGIIPLVSNSPLISWHFKLFGPYLGSDIIGLTEITAALLIAAGYFRPKAGVIGGLITTVMFFTTSTMLLTTPGATIAVHGMRYMSFLGLFLYKDVISLGVSLYLIGYFGNKAILLENRGE